jgi:hypothetical protein
MATEDEELQEVAVTGANRNPGVIKRVERAPEHFAGGTLLPRLKGLINPSLYRERGDTNRLVDSVLGEEGALSRLAASNPDLVTEIRQQADTPMTSAEHEKFRSGLLSMVTDEVARNQKIQYTLGDNKSFFDAFKTLDGFLPGIGSAQVDTREEYERRQIETLYKQAQQAALIDPDHSSTLMGEVRKKADALTESTRTDMEKQRRVARAEDSSLWATHREKLSETSDVIAALQDDLDKKGLRRPPSPELIARASALLGRAGDFPSAGVGDAAADATSLIPEKAGDSGNMLGEAVALAGKLTDKALQSNDVKYLIQRLQFNAQQVQASYTQDRAALADKYKASGLQFGEKPGEIYSVPNEAYTRAAEKIKAADKKPTDDVDSLRGTLDDEVANAQAVVDKVAPEASANMPGAAARHQSALERLRIAQDDKAIFEADQQPADAKAPPTAQLDDAAVELQKARQRRAVRQQQQNSGLVRKATMEALRGYTR